MPLVLDVYLNATPVGQITELPADRSIFVFNETYEEDQTRPTLSLGFKGTEGRIAYDPRPTQQRLIPFFANLLPEGRLRRYIAEKAGVHRDREMRLMTVVGDDLPGAVIVRPQGHPPDPDNILANVDENDAANNGPVKFSLAGVQLKFSAIQGANGGLTIPATGRGGSWIVKLPSEQFDAVSENEAAMMELARTAGFDMPDFRLVPTQEIAGLPEGMNKAKRAYVVRRFDREGNKRIHIEDFAQVFNLYPEQKYEKASYRNIAYVIWQETGEVGLREFIGRLVFSAAIGNGDMHLKNWSFIYRDGRTPALSPAYDFVSTLTYVGGPETMALNLSGTKSFAELDEARFIRLAEKAQLPPEIVRSAALDAAARTAAAWADLRSNLDAPASVLDAIERHMKTVPIMSEAGRPRVKVN